MGKLNEIQEEVKQSFGSNSFTTTIKENTVEFDSAKDSFTFLDPVNVPAINVNGEPLTPAEPQVQADWNQNDNTQPDYIKNRVCYDSRESSSLTYVDTIINNQGGFDTNVEGGQPYCYYFNEPEGAELIQDGTVLPIKIGSVETTVTMQAQYGILMGNINVSMGSGQIVTNTNPNVPYRFFITGNFDSGTYAGKSVKIEVTETSGELVTIPDKYIPQLGGVKFKIESGALKASIDGGTTWKSITLS